MDYSEKIKKFRKEAGYSQSEMADLTGISQAAYGKIESGFTKSITLNIAVAIAQSFNVKFDDFFEIPHLLRELPVDSESYNKLIFLQEKVKELEKRIEEKDLVINSQRTTRNFLISEFIRHIETRSVKNPYWIVKQGFKYAKTEEEKSLVKKFIDKYEKERQGMYDNFIAQGLLTKTEIDQHLNEINSIYEEQDLEQAFNRFFSE